MKGRSCKKNLFIGQTCNAVNNNLRCKRQPVLEKKAVERTFFPLFYFFFSGSRGEKVLYSLVTFLILNMCLSGHEEQGHSYCSGPRLCAGVGGSFSPLSFSSLPLSLLFLLRCRWPHLQVNWNSWRHIISFLLLTHICLDFFFFNSNIIYK